MRRTVRVATIGTVSLMVGIASALAAPGGGHGGGTGGGHGGGMGGGHGGGMGGGHIGAAAGAHVGGAPAAASTAAVGQHAFVGRPAAGGVYTGRSVGFSHGGARHRFHGRFLGGGFGYGCDPTLYQQGFCDYPDGY